MRDGEGCYGLQELQDSVKHTHAFLAVRPLVTRRRSALDQLFSPYYQDKAWPYSLGGTAGYAVVGHVDTFLELPG